MKRGNRRRLALRIETLRRLTDDELRAIAAGRINTFGSLPRTLCGPDCNDDTTCTC
jgi:hypothetical protein